MYYTGIDPFTKQEVYIARGLRGRKTQRVLMQFFKPENYFEVCQELTEAGRSDLIGGGCDCLIPAQPPKKAIKERMDRASDYVHAIPGQKRGYRPGENRSSGRRSRNAKAAYNELAVMSMGVRSCRSHLPEFASELNIPPRTESPWLKLIFITFS